MTNVAGLGSLSFTAISSLLHDDDRRVDLVKLLDNGPFNGKLFDFLKSLGKDQNHSWTAHVAPTVSATVTGKHQEDNPKYVLYLPPITTGKPNKALLEVRTYEKFTSLIKEITEMEYTDEDEYGSEDEDEFENDSICFKQGVILDLQAWSDIWGTLILDTIGNHYGENNNAKALIAALSLEIQSTALACIVAGLNSNICNTVVTAIVNGLCHSNLCTVWAAAQSAQFFHGTKFELGVGEISHWIDPSKSTEFPENTLDIAKHLILYPKKNLVLPRTYALGKKIVAIGFLVGTNWKFIPGGKKYSKRSRYNLIACDKDNEQLLRTSVENIAKDLQYIKI